MRARIAAAAGTLAVAGPVLFEIKKALGGFKLIPIASQGMEVAWQGGDIGPYIVALLLVAVGILLPLRLIQALGEI